MPRSRSNDRSAGSRTEGMPESPARFDAAHASEKTSYEAGRFDVTGDRQHRDEATVTVVSPYWLRVTWTLTEGTLKRAEKALGREWPRARPTLRLRGLAVGEETAREVTQESDHDIPGDAREWFLAIPTEAFAEAIVGYRVPGDGGRFFPMAESDPVPTRSATGPVIEPERTLAEAGLPDDVLEELQRMRTGVERFSFSIIAEMTLSGRSQPDAEITIGEHTLTADAGGSFELSLPLENGRTVLPITARSTIGRESRNGVASADFNLRLLENDSEDTP